jgi:hypothetical protein
MYYVQKQKVPVQAARRPLLIISYLTVAFMYFPYAHDELAVDVHHSIASSLSKSAAIS